MRLSRGFAPTLKESPADAQVASHVFLIRGGFMRKLAAGIYNFLPLGWRVIRKVEEIIRQELDRAGALEVLMPAAVPAELWQESGRWAVYGPELLRFKDRKGADFCIGPTHEEVIVEIVRRDVKSYRELPLNLYQIQSKFRDELRPRAGLLRGREFIMKDAYSFDVSEEKAVASYMVMYQAYERIFRRCGLSFRPVEADTGAIGGSRSHEFQVLAESGEDTLVACSTCDYAANVEQAEWGAADPPTAPGVTSTRQVVATPGKKTIEEVAGFLKLSAERLIKTLLYVADGKPLAVLVRGDRAVNEIKLKKLLGAVDLFMAADNHVQELTGAPAGFAGPIGLSIPIVADDELRGMIGAVAGANQADAHITGIDVDRDVPGARWGRLRLAVAGDRCPRCAAGRFQVLRGIEVGHVFYLGTKYSAPMACNFLAEDGTAKPMEMGCYGIGVTRVAAAAIEQNHDGDGIIWPMSIAPYEVALLTLQANEPEVVAAAERLYAALTAKGIEVLLDDREERPGAKFKDADLIGVPLRLAVGKKSLAEGRVELKWRRDKQVNQIPIDDAVDHVAGLVAAERARLAGA